MEIRVDKEVEEFIDSLDEQTIAKVLRSIDFLEEFGYKLGMPHSKKIARDIFELRIRGKRDVRIFYTFRRDRVVLFHAFVKKSSRLPSREINKATRKLEDLT